MTFWRRLRIYLVGVGLGLLIVYVFFKDRDLSGWTPEGRVLTAIDSSAVTVSNRAMCQIVCYNLHPDVWSNMQKNASVNFSESNTRKEPCPVYHLESMWEEQNYLLIWEVCEAGERAQLLSIIKEGVSCDCD